MIGGKIGGKKSNTFSAEYEGKTYKFKTTESKLEFMKWFKKTVKKSIECGSCSRLIFPD